MVTNWCLKIFRRLIKHAINQYRNRKVSKNMYAEHDFFSDNHCDAAHM